MGGINAAKQAVRNHALNASQMQSRLDRALLHYHNFLTRNKTLQSEIQELRSAPICIFDGNALLQAAISACYAWAACSRHCQNFTASTELKAMG